MRGQPVHNAQPHARLPPTFLDAWMTSQLKVLWFASCVGHWCAWLILFFTCHPWMFVQPGTGRRPFDGCRNKMSVLYMPRVTILRLERSIKTTILMISFWRMNLLKLFYAVYHHPFSNFPFNTFSCATKAKKLKAWNLVQVYFTTNLSIFYMNTSHWALDPPILAASYQ